MKQNFKFYSCCALLVAVILAGCGKTQKTEESTTETASKPKQPNVVLIYADDLGYGDVSAYGATKVSTPNIDKIANNGMRFTNAHATSATCTPSRYSMLTGRYAWRKRGTGVARGNAGLIIDTARTTLATVFKKADYATGVVGKWHLGLGPQEGPDWNGEITPGPKQLDFDYSFLIPATGDRVPCVYLENDRVVDLDPADPIQVSYKEKIGDEPTGKENPELLKMKPSHGHDMTIVNGISRIGYMTGGKAARWVDEDMADVITHKAKKFLTENKDNPFFLFFSTHDIHVPRVPHSRFAGKSGMGPRGDAILQLDWCVGEVMNTLEELGLSENTIVIFTSDNGPVVDDGYEDEAVEKLNGHTPAGPLRGGKYSAFDAGTRIPMLIQWPGTIQKGKVTDAMTSQIDFKASFASLLKVEVDAYDSENLLDALTGKTATGREYLIEHSGTLGIIKDGWKYIEPSKGPKVFAYVDIESGYTEEPQLYNLNEDMGEEKNLAAEHPEKLEELKTLLEEVKNQQDI
ncbi:arylsulfatase [Rapidithrix thailandica]|uniref:Arylsulfatase n=1 Tax=Rapidithrix thailandica TaxID=413964 RepID=A0AAW9RX45_9BACT